LSDAAAAAAAAAAADDATKTTTVLPSYLSILQLKPYRISFHSLTKFSKKKLIRQRPPSAASASVLPPRFLYFGSGVIS
jgi:hypothetical protein